MAETNTSEESVLGQTAKEDAVDNKYNSYVNSIGQASDKLKAGKASMAEAKKKLEETDAEKMASEATSKKGKPLTLAEASAILEQEEKAKKAYKDAAKDNIQTSIDTVREAFKGSKEVIGAAIDDVKRGESVGLGGTIALLGLGGVLGAALPTAGREVAANLTATVGDAWTNLNNNNPTDSESKYVEGYESAENAGASTAKYTQKSPTGYKPGTGPDATGTKVPVYNEDYKVADADDALNVTPDMMSLFANLGKGTSAVDFLRAFSDKSENSADFASMVASKVADVIADHVENNGTDEPDAVKKLNEENEKLNSGTNTPDVNGPSVS